MPRAASSGGLSGARHNVLHARMDGGDGVLAGGHDGRQHRVRPAIPGPHVAPLAVPPDPPAPSHIFVARGGRWVAKRAVSVGRCLLRGRPLPANACLRLEVVLSELGINLLNKLTKHDKLLGCRGGGDSFTGRLGFLRAGFPLRLTPVVPVPVVGRGSSGGVPPRPLSPSWSCAGLGSRWSRYERPLNPSGCCMQADFPSPRLASGTG